jgi:hypothetical protein
MTKYLREIEISGVILMFIGCIMHRFFHIDGGVYVCGMGLIIWLLNLIYKAFHWKEYERDNKQNIVMMIAVIIMLFIMIFSRL